MTTSWFTSAEISAAIGITERAVNQLSARQGWRYHSDKARKRPGRGGGWEYHESLLPQDWRAQLVVSNKSECDEQQPDQSDLWTRYERLTAKQKQVCETRLKRLQEVEFLIEGGMGETAAIRSVARDHELSRNTLMNWRGMVKGVAVHDRLAALAPEWKGSSPRLDMHPQAWAVLKSDYLRPEAPTFTACYRRMLQAASREGWSPIANERALRRRLKAEVPVSAQVVARQGREAAKGLYPAQRRTKTHMHAMQAVNMDGHKLDVFVRMDDGRVTRVMLIAIQDVYSAKFLAWRIAESENKDAVRLVIGDMVETYGIPDRIYLDNSRAFASKWISGAAKNRFRFKHQPDDPNGLLEALGVETIFVTPYSGQSKPIERAFRDLTEEIARHPACSGAYTGNRPDAKPENYGDRALPIEVLRQHVTAQIMEHNARDGRRTEVAQGRSFDAAFTESLSQPSTVVRWPTQAQKSLWLKPAESIRAKRGSGEIHFQRNRYWSPELNAYAGQKLTIRFDPDKLHDGISVYDLEDRLICHARCIADEGFDSTEAARRIAKHRNEKMKHDKALAKLHAEVPVEELQRLYEGPVPEKPEPQRSKVVRLAVGNDAHSQRKEVAEWDEEAEREFGENLRLIAQNQSH